MSINSELVLSLGGVLGPALIRCLGSTWIIRQSGIGNYYNRLFGSDKRSVYSFWHRDILLLGYFTRNEGNRVLISEHRDGELIDRVVKKLGFSTFRGSSTRGGEKALRELNRIKADPSNCDIAITPDGPKGPAKTLKKGIIYIASRTGFPIQTVGVASDRCWRVKSWDRFKIPKPFSRTFVVYGPEVDIPPDLDGNELEPWRVKVEQEMVDTERRARESLEAWCHD